MATISQYLDNGIFLWELAKDSALADTMEGHQHTAVTAECWYYFNWVLPMICMINSQNMPGNKWL